MPTNIYGVEIPEWVARLEGKSIPAGVAPMEYAATLPSVAPPASITPVSTNGGTTVSNGNGYQSYGGETLPAVISSMLPANWQAALGGAAGVGLAGVAGWALLELLTSGISLDWGTAGPGFLDIGVPGPGVFGSNIPGMRQGEQPVKKWYTGTATFYLTNMGRIAVQKKTGVWRIWKPRKPIVLSSNPNIRTLVRAEKTLSKWANSVYRVKTRKTKFTKSRK